MLSKLNTHKRVVGAKQVKRALALSDVEIKELCNTKQIRIIHVDTMENLGKACGIGINAAVAALLK